MIAELLAYSSANKIVVLSGQNDEAHPRYTRTMGAVEFVVRTANPLQLKNVLMQALRPVSAEPFSVVRLLSESEPICKLCEQIGRFAPSLYPVLVHAESGNGKELVAYWNRFSRPEKTAKYEPLAFDTWWVDEAKDKALRKG